MKIKVRQAYDDHKLHSDETGLACKDPSLAQQQFKEDSDINTLVERFHLTGEMPQLQQLPTFQDFGNIWDFQTAMNAIRSAQETFMSLPAPLRAKFDNDPQKFLAFTSDAQNLPEARKLGILSDEAIKRIEEHERRVKNEQEQDIIAQHEAKKEKPPKAAK